MLNVKKGDTVILHMFTGIPVGVKQVIKADKKTFTIVTGKGDTVFDKKTGYQLEPECKSDKYRNYCTEDDGSFEDYRKGKATKPAKKTAKKTNTKKAKVEDEDDDEDEDEEEEERPAKKKSSKKPAKKAAPKKSKKVDDDLDDYEDAEEEDEDDEDEE